MQINHILILIAGGVLAYLLGSFSSAVWIGKWFYHVDVRNQGSGNAGATNTIRVLGTKAGIVVLLLDLLKALAAVLLASLLSASFLNQSQLVNYKVLAGALAVVGHVFPLYTGFRGGKGVASLVGVILGVYSPIIILYVLAWFIFVFLLTRYVSLASISSSLVFAVLVIFVFHETNQLLIILATAIAIFLPLTHHKNIKRLLKGEESKLTFKKQNKAPGS